jgi:LacI family transcriptional regulator
MSTIRDVAKLAGVSRGTVSNFLNRPALVAISTRERVQRAIQELEFVPSFHARVLAGGHGFGIGLVVDSVANPFFVEIARGVEEVASRSGYVVSLVSTQADSDRERQALRALQAQRVAGILLTPARRSPAIVKQLRADGIAVVLLDAQGGENECSVAVDDHLGGLLAGRHLVQCGYRSFVFIGDLKRAQHAARFAGLSKALDEAALPGSRSLRLLHATSLTQETGQAVGASLLKSKRKIPGAAFCGNDLLAVGFIRGLEHGGLRVPEDVAVVGYDDIPLVSLMAAPVTSVRQPMYELGKHATSLLLDEITSPEHKHQHVSFAPQLIERTTVRSRDYG